MPIRENKTIYYRAAVSDKDSHGTVTNLPSETLSSIVGRLKPQTLREEVKDAGLILTGDYVIYVPLSLNPNFSVKQGDGFYLADDTDTNKDPKWYVVNVPYKYLKHTILVLRNKV